MKRLISKFSDKLLSNASLRAVKGAGIPYCFCDGSPVDCPSGVSGGGDACPGTNPISGWKVGGSKFYKGARRCGGGTSEGSNGYGDC